VRKSSLCVGVLCFLAFATLSGCSSSSTPQVAVALSPSSAQTLDQGQSVNITATVSNDSTSKGVSWTLSGVGTLSNQTATGATYNAPATVTSSGTATVTATSVASSAATAQVSITINPAPQVKTTSLPAAPEYTSYTTTLQATGGSGAITWKVSSGSLPTWASLNASTGVLSGTPNASGPTNFSVTVTDADGVTSAAQALTLTVNPPPTLSITTTSLPNGTAGTSYSATLQATGGFGAYTWSIASGSLPTGISLNASTGVISGQSNTAATSSFTVKVTDSQPTPASAASSLSITIAPPPALAITTTSLPNGTAGTSYSATLQASGGISPYTWSISSGSLPAWASLNASTGVISGMPNASGTTSFTVQVTDSESPTVSLTKALSITIAAPPALTISTTSLPNGNVGTAYTSTLAATGGVQPYTWSISSGKLPTWAQLNASTGVISGTPDAQATTNFTVQVTDSEATPVSTTQALSITINAAAGTNDAELNGHYAMVLQGFDDATGNEFAISASFVADGKGNITSGIADVNGLAPATGITLNGTYTIGSDNRGTLTLNGSDASSRIFAIAVGSLNSSSIATKAAIVEFDDSNGTSGHRGSGMAYLQDTTAFALSSVKGPYAFQMAGQENGPGTRMVNVGAFTTDGNGNVTNGVLDSNSGGTIGSSTFSGTFSADANTATFGRLSMDVGGAAIVYIVSASRLLLMTTDTLAGEVRAQSTTSFSASSLNGTSILYASGQGSTAGDSSATVGLLTFNGSGSGTYNNQSNDSGTTHTDSGSFTYTVSSNGRVAISTGGSHDPILYLVGPNEGFEMETNLSAKAGYFEPQTGGPFSNSSVSGNYFSGVMPPGVTNDTVSSGVGTSTGNGTLTSTEDVSSPSGLTSAYSLSYTLTISSNGSVTDTLGDIMYVISPNKFVVMDSTSTEPVVTIVQK
jgi:hypothetical protein